MKFKHRCVATRNFPSRLSIFASIRVIFVLLLLTIVSACTLLEPTRYDTANISHVSQLTEWQARGKVLLRNQDEKVSGYFFWHKNADDFTLSLNSFIGTNVLTLTVTGGVSTLEVDGERYQSNDPEQLIYDVTGNVIPVAKLSSWLLANVNNTQHKKNNGTLISNQKVQGQKLMSFRYQAPRQSPWLVSYNDYKPVAQLQLPHKLNVQNADTKIKLTINHWELMR